MIDSVEDSRTEFKVELVDDLEETVIFFLNKDGDNIYIGVDDNGNIVGLKNNCERILMWNYDIILFIR